MSILIDTGVFYAFYNRLDIHHMDSICLLTHIFEGRYGRPYTTDLVLSETYTLLRHRIGFNTAVGFLQILNKIDVKTIFLDSESYSETISILERCFDKKLSFTDAFLIYTLRNYGIEYIASYDERAFSGIANIIGRNYAKSLPKNEFNRILRLIKSLK